MRRYDPSPPPAEEVDAEKFTFKLATVTVDNNKKGWSRFNFSLSNEVRQRHLGDPVHCEQWKGLIQEFDRKLLAKFNSHVDLNPAALNNMLLYPKSYTRMHSQSGWKTA